MNVTFFRKKSHCRGNEVKDLEMRSWTFCMRAKLLQSCLTLCDPMDHSPQAPLSMRFSRQEYWSGLPCPPPGDLSDPRTGLGSLMSSALAGRFFTTSATWEAPRLSRRCKMQ